MRLSYVHDAHVSGFVSCVVVLIPFVVRVCEETWLRSPVWLYLFLVCLDCRSSARVSTSTEKKLDFSCVAWLYHSYDKSSSWILYSLFLVILFLILTLLSTWYMFSWCLNITLKYILVGVTQVRFILEFLFMRFFHIDLFWKKRLELASDLSNLIPHTDFKVQTLHTLP